MDPTVDWVCDITDGDTIETGVQAHKTTLKPILELGWNQTELEYVMVTLTISLSQAALRK